MRYADVKIGQQVYHTSRPYGPGTVIDKVNTNEAKALVVFQRGKRVVPVVRLTTDKPKVDK